MGKQQPQVMINHGGVIDNSIITLTVIDYLVKQGFSVLMLLQTVAQFHDNQYQIEVGDKAIIFDHGHLAIYKKSAVFVGSPILRLDYADPKFFDLLDETLK